jgi:hypothetical protein
MAGKHHCTGEGLNNILTLFASLILSPDRLQNTYSMWWTESHIGPILGIFSGRLTPTQDSKRLRFSEKV